MNDLATLVLKEYRVWFAAYRRYAEKTLVQVTDETFFAIPNPEPSPLAIQVKHLGYNFCSRWTEFLTTDGEKPDRYCDREFEIEEGDTREALMEKSAEGWQRLTETLHGLTPDDLARTVMILSEPHSVIEALSRGLAHAAYHTGQIVLSAKHYAGPDWQTLSIARGQSEAFAAEMRARHQSAL